MTPHLHSLLAHPDSRLHRVTYGGRSGAELRALLDGDGIGLNAFALALLADDRFPVSPPGSQAAVVELPVAVLGFATGATMPQLRTRAAELGLGDCPLDLAPWLRLAWLDQAEGADAGRHQAPAGSVTVVSARLEADEDAPCGFYLRVLAGRRWLRGYASPEDHGWRAADRLAFRVIDPLQAPEPPPC